MMIKIEVLRLKCVSLDGRFVTYKNFWWQCGLCKRSVVSSCVSTAQPNTLCRCASTKDVIVVYEMKPMGYLLPDGFREMIDEELEAEIDRAIKSEISALRRFNQYKNRGQNETMFSC